MGDRLLPSHIHFQIRSALLPIFAEKVEGPFSTSITVNSLNNRLALFTIYIAPCILFCTIFNLKEFETYFALNQRTTWELLWCLERFLFIKQFIFPQLSWRILSLLWNNSHEFSLRGWGKLLLAKGLPPDVLRQMLIPFCRYMSLKECLEEFLFLIFYLISMKVIFQQNMTEPPSKKPT